METTKRGGEATSGGGITSNGGSISPHHPHIHPPTGHGAFGQQSIPAWQPVLAPRWTIIGLVVLGIVCVTLGTVLTLASNSVVECSIRYNDPSKDCGDACVNTIILTKDHCQGPLQTIKDTDYIPGKSFLYYALTQFHQNHRRYLLSRSEAQLAGDAIIDPDLLKDCEPALMSEDGYTILSPCGLAAKSVFNDTYKLKSQTGEYYALKETLDDIVWPESIKTRYKNPTLNGEDEQKKINQWLDDTIFPGKVENPHFIIWMRNAALPNFKKLYAVVEESLQLPLHIEVANRYPVESFRGTKSVVISTTSWIGGKDTFLGLAFISLGSLLFVVGLFMAIKNRRDPRILGDVRFLKWRRVKAT